MFLPKRQVEYHGHPVTIYESAEEMCRRMGWMEEWESARERLLRSFSRPRLVLPAGGNENLRLRAKYD